MQPLGYATTHMDLVEITYTPDTTAARGDLVATAAADAALTRVKIRDIDNNPIT